MQLQSSMEHTHAHAHTDRGRCTRRKIAYKHETLRSRAYLLCHDRKNSRHKYPPKNTDRLCGYIRYPKRKISPITVYVSPGTIVPRPRVLFNPLRTRGKSCQHVCCVVVLPFESMAAFGNKQSALCCGSNGWNNGLVECSCLRLQDAAFIKYTFSIVKNNNSCF